MRQPCFNNLLKVLARKRPERPTLFELHLNDPLLAKLAGPEIAGKTDRLADFRLRIHGFKNAGYDHASVMGAEFRFTRAAAHEMESHSQNELAVIRSRDEFKAHRWPDPDACDYSALGDIAPELPVGMKLMVHGPRGVLQNVINLVGYENLCFMLADDEALAGEIFEAVGSRLVRYFQHCLRYETVGCAILNDDWGFKTQTLLSVAQMRKYVLPWHKKFVEVVHAAGKPAIWHSCGQVYALIDDIINDLRYDARHSFEDVILPVEQAYSLWSDRIAILGGLDVDFLCRSTPEQIKSRCQQMLQLCEKKGGYALGSGNSVPDYVPEASFRAMIAAVE